MIIVYVHLIPKTEFWSAPEVSIAPKKKASGLRDRRTAASGHEAVVIETLIY